MRVRVVQQLGERQRRDRPREVGLGLGQAPLGRLQAALQPDGHPRLVPQREIVRQRAEQCVERRRLERHQPRGHPPDARVRGEIGWQQRVHVRGQRVEHPPRLHEVALVVQRHHGLGDLHGVAEHHRLLLRHHGGRRGGNGQRHGGVVGLLQRARHPRGPRRGAVARVERPSQLQRPRRKPVEQRRGRQRAHRRHLEHRVRGKPSQQNGSGLRERHLVRGQLHSRHLVQRPPQDLLAPRQVARQRAEPDVLVHVRGDLVFLDQPVRGGVRVRGPLDVPDLQQRPQQRGQDPLRLRGTAGVAGQPFPAVRGGFGEPPQPRQHPDLLLDHARRAVRHRPALGGEILAEMLAQRVHVTDVVGVFGPCAVHRLHGVPALPVAVRELLDHRPHLVEREPGVTAQPARDPLVRPVQPVPLVVVERPRVLLLGGPRPGERREHQVVARQVVRRVQQRDPARDPERQVPERVGHACGPFQRLVLRHARGHVVRLDERSFCVLVGEVAHHLPPTARSSSSRNERLSAAVSFGRIARRACRTACT